MSEHISPQISGYELIRVSVRWQGDVLASWTQKEELVSNASAKTVFQNFYNYYERLDGSNFSDLKKLEELFEKLCSQAQKKESQKEFSYNFNDFIRILTAFLEPVEENSEGVSYGEGYEGLKADYKQEMERLGRDGREFCICLLSVVGNQVASIDILRALINSQLRGFDSVFKLDENKIALSLKQTDKNGANRFLRRVQNKFFTDNNSKFNAVISQPVLGEVLNSVMLNLQKDLSALQVSASGDIVILQELSPLERHLKEASSN